MTHLERSPPSVTVALRLRRGVMLLVAGLIVYGNLCVVLQPPALLNHRYSPFPDAPFMRDAFLMPGMFSTYSRTNLDPYIGGLRDNSGEPATRERWVRLPLKEHFVQRHGIAFLQLYAMRQRNVLGTTGQRKAWAFLAARIRQRHNRLHPDRQVVRIRIGATHWPISPEGYRAKKRAPDLRAATWFEEPAP